MRVVSVVSQDNKAPARGSVFGKVRAVGVDVIALGEFGYPGYHGFEGQPGDSREVAKFKS